MSFADGEAAIDEVEQYQKLPAPSLPAPLKSFDLLAYWNGISNTLPGLKRLSDRVLCIQASSAASERLFSNAGFIVNDRRVRLSSGKVDDLLCLKWNNPK